MRKVMVAVLSAIVVGLMLVPSGASAGTIAIVIQDRTGDLMQQFDPATADMTHVQQNGTPVAVAGYFDMLSMSLSKDAKIYTFGMKVAADLPKEGSLLPNGFHQVQWLMWIDAEPWNPVYNPTAETLFTVELTYDGSHYVAELRQGLSAGTVLATLPFAIDGSTLQVQFTASSIGNMKSFWFMPCTVVRHGPLGTGGYWDLDGADPGAAPGQVWWDIPWGSPAPYTPP